MKPLEARYDEQGRHLCSSTRRDGEPCRAPAIRGHRVCNKHGGQLPSVKAAAQRRLLEAADPAAAELVRLALEAEDPTVRLRAIRDLLDRAGIREPKQVEVITLEMIDAEITRLEDELGIEHGATSGYV